MADEDPTGAPGDALGFTGTWRDYLPIALSNLALTIVTLGIYRFWAKARERRYLWSHTRFIDDRLEWTGTGKEMFIGFVFAMLILAPLFLVIRFGAEALFARGMAAGAVVATLLIYGAIFYLFGVARFRGLRYRLSRTYWHGIRGGSNDPGFSYGVSYLWKSAAGGLALGLLVPWSMTRLWNERWNEMSFGGDEFASAVTTEGLIGRWILLLLSPFVAVFVVGALIVALGFSAGLPQTLDPAHPPLAFMVTMVLAILSFYLIMGLLGVGYYAAFYRKAIGHLMLGDLQFEFNARSKDWLVLAFGDVAVVVGTLGIGISFLGYRHWSFLIRHLGASGTVSLDRLVQSSTRVPREAEGFIDAFDIGAV